MNYKLIRKLTYLYLLLPCLIFLLGFLKWYISVPVSVLFFLITCKGNDFFTEKTDSDKTKRINLLLLLITIGLASAIWTGWCGQGTHIWYQSSDWEARNAILRDLVTHPWPVVYEWKDTALCYYIGHWMVPALLGKIAYSLAGYSAGWFVARIVLWVWTWLGVCLVLSLILIYVSANTWQKILKAIVIFVFFSGMDFFGAFFRAELSSAYNYNLLHLEWWLPYQYSSITTCLAWVFNQSITPWIIVCLLMLDTSVKEYGFLLVSGLLCGPLPMVGIVWIMLLKIIRLIVKDGEKAWKWIFSKENIVIVLSVFPIIAAYYKSNGAVAGLGSNRAAALDAPSTILFFLMDAGIYLLLLWKDYRHDLIYYGVVILLLACPLIRIGESYDFTMRASIPGIFIMMLYCMDMVINRKGEPVNAQGYVSSEYRFRRNIMIICLMIGAATPVLELYRPYAHYRTEPHYSHVADWRKSMEYTEPQINFETFHYQDSIFYKYLAKNSERCRKYPVNMVEVPDSEKIAAVESVEKELQNRGFNIPFPEWDRWTVARNDANGYIHAEISGFTGEANDYVAAWLESGGNERGMKFHYLFANYDVLVDDGMVQ